MITETCALEESQGAWLDALRNLNRSPKTIDVYRQCLRLLARFAQQRGCREPHNVTPQLLEQWRRSVIDSGLKPASLSVYLRATKGWTTWLAARGELFIDPCRDLRSPRVPPSRCGAPSPAEMLTLIESIQPNTPVGVRDRAILETAYATALRRTELAKLGVSDVDLERRTVRCTGKGGRDRVVPLTRKATTWIEQYRALARPALATGNCENALWLNLRGRSMSGESLARMIRQRAREFGLNGVTPHAIRRACATHLLQNDAHPAQIRQLLGHVSFKHLNHYLRLGFRDLQRAHARSRIGR